MPDRARWIATDNSILICRLSEQINSGTKRKGECVMKVCRNQTFLVYNKKILVNFFFMINLMLRQDIYFCLP